MGAAVGVAVGATFALGILPWLQRRALRQTRGLTGSFEAHLDRQGIRISSDDGREMTRRWTDLERLLPDREHLFLYWKDGQVAVLPRRAFADQVAEDQIRALIQGKDKEARSAGKSGRSTAAAAGIELRLDRTPEDLAYFAWHQNLHDPALRVRSWFSYVVVTGLVIYLAAAVVPWWGAVLAGLMVSAVLPRLYYGLLKHQGATMLRQAGHQQVVVRFDASGVTESAGGSAAKIRWEQIERIEQTSRLLLIYVDRLQAVVIPRRSLGTEAEAQSRLTQIRDWHAAGRSRPDGMKAKR